MAASKRRPSITTRTGDGGTTRLFSGEEVPKHASRVEALGAVDETVSTLGLARAFARRIETRDAIRAVQRDLFVVGAEIATSIEAIELLTRRIDAGCLADLDRRRDALEAATPWPQGFVVPGANPASAHLDHARSVARRLERCVTRLLDEGVIANRTLLMWLNRLSDYLWLLARSEEEHPDLLDVPE
ncbi:MAG: cob(I)yrinic acid a,c-diamide adenosyltransferase [Verrucomicrobia bacterium]|nr:cob(I)yrinic acid a,c-diamide adenosyltransferase [Verrucomicrobiota bacterium]